jgi:hypothetical protein
MPRRRSARRQRGRRSPCPGGAWPGARSPSPAKHQTSQAGPPGRAGPAADGGGAGTRRRAASPQPPPAGDRAATAKLAPGQPAPGTPVRNCSMCRPGSHGRRREGGPSRRGRWAAAAGWLPQLFWNQFVDGRHGGGSCHDQREQQEPVKAPKHALRACASRVNGSAEAVTTPTTRSVPTLMGGQAPVEPASPYAPSCGWSVSRSSS